MALTLWQQYEYYWYIYQSQIYIHTITSHKINNCNFNNEKDYNNYIVQTLGGIWQKYWNIWIENTFARIIMY